MNLFDLGPQYKVILTDDKSAPEISIRLQDVPVIEINRYKMFHILNNRHIIMAALSKQLGEFVEQTLEKLSIKEHDKNVGKSKDEIPIRF